MANPTLLDMPIARDGNKNTIPTTDNGTTGLLSQQYGWQLINAIPPQQGGKAVKREDFNGALYLLSNLLFYLQKGFTFEYDETQDYYKNCIVLDPTDGKMYRAKNDVSASATHPSADSTNWELFDLLTLLANYLPLTGGALKGNAPIYNDTDERSLNLLGGTLADWGSFVQLDGRAHSPSRGPFAVLSCRSDQTNDQYLLRIGGRDGVLQWGPYSGAGNYYDLGGSAIVAKSLGVNSYVKRASGEIIQWGETYFNTDSDVSDMVTFPIAFSTIRSVFALGTTEGRYLAIHEVNSLTQVKFKANRAVNYQTSAYWFAIGY